MPTNCDNHGANLSLPLHSGWQIAKYQFQICNWHFAICPMLGLPGSTLTQSVSEDVLIVPRSRFGLVCQRNTLTRRKYLASSTECQGILDPGLPKSRRLRTSRRLEVTAAAGQTTVSRTPAS